MFRTTWWWVNNDNTLIFIINNHFNKIEGDWGAAEIKTKQKICVEWTHLCFHHRSSFWAQRVVDGDGVTQNSTAVPTATVLLPLVHREIWTNHTQERAERGKEQLEDGEKEGWMITVRALAGAQGRGQLCMQKTKTKLSTRKKTLLTLCNPGNHSLIYHEYLNIICCTKQIKLPREKKNEAMIFYAKEHSEPK